MTQFKRRNVIKSGLAIGLAASLPTPVMATTDLMETSIVNTFGKRPVVSDKIKLKIPPISENGYSVLVDIDVESAMTETDYVKRIAVFSERNPVPLLAIYTLSPRSGRARVSSRVRLGGTQNVHAIAEMNDGRLIYSSAKTLVTIAACVVL